MAIPLKCVAVLFRSSPEGNTTMSTIKAYNGYQPCHRVLWMLPHWTLPSLTAEWLESSPPNIGVDCSNPRGPKYDNRKGYIRGWIYPEYSVAWLIPVVGFDSWQCSAVQCSAVQPVYWVMASAGIMLRPREDPSAITCHDLQKSQTVLHWPSHHCIAQTIHCTAQITNTLLHSWSQPYSAVHNTSLHCTALQYTSLQCTAMQYTSLQCTALHCKVENNAHFLTLVPCTSLHCN